MSTDQDLPEGGAPRVRRDGPGGLRVVRGKTAEGQSAWWRLVGDNGEILAHSEAYASLGNAARGADAAERTVIRNAHDCGPTLYALLRELDAGDASDGPVNNDATREELRAVWGPELLSTVEGHLSRGDYALLHQLLIRVGAAAVTAADVLRSDYGVAGES